MKYRYGKPRRLARAEGLERRELLAANVIINEIHYDPNPKTQFVEFIELLNAGDQAADLSGWKITDAVEYQFPAGTLVAPDAYLVVSQDPNAVREKFGIESLGPWVGKLNNSGESISLADAGNAERDRVDYQLGFPWPTVGDAPGYSIELVNPSLDNQLGGSWRPSVGTDPRIAAGAPWRFFRGTREASEPTTAWRQPGFDDSSWEIGLAPIGAGETFVVTELENSRNTYTTVFLRKTFTIDDVSAVDALQLEVMFDDGVNIWINGTHVAKNNVFEENMPYNFPANTSIENKEFVEIPLPNPSNFLASGENVIAVQLANSSISDRDLFFDARLFLSTDRQPGPTPGALNSVAQDVAPPQMRQVSHDPRTPTSRQDVTITAKVTDPDGVRSVELHYQLVDPGDFIRKTDGRYQTDWSTRVMRDDGTGGDAEAGDDVFTAILDGQLQTHRRLVRYRLQAVDSTGQTVTAPYADDPQPNFAYFVYDGVPEWTGADRPGQTDTVTFSQAVMNQLPVYHLIAVEDDVIASQYRVEDGRFQGTMVYDGRVYDHIEFRSRGEFSTFVSGKNKWKIFFNRGHEFQVRDNYGRPYQEGWRLINFSNASTPWVVMNRGMAGIDEAIAYRLYDLAGAPSPHTNFFQLRVIDGADEAPADQYAGDLWGLYLTLEEPEGRFLDERGLPDGTTYKVESAGGDIKNQGPTQPDAATDFRNFMRDANRSQPEAWWRENVDLDTYFTFRAINRAVNNMDLRDGWNHFLYHNPETNKWSVIPWDLDMLYVPTTHWSGVIRLENMFRNASLAIEYRNRARELQDLLFNADQVNQLVDEYAGFVNPQTGGLTMVDVDQFMWNYHPRTSAGGAYGHRGMFNRLVADYGAGFQGPDGDRTLVSADHEGFVQWIKDFLLPAPGGGSRPAGYGAKLLDDHAKDSDIPLTPTIRYVGAEGFSLDGLRLETSSFRDPQGDDTFAALEWRIAEVTDANAANFDASAPKKYEIQPTWESGELTTFSGQISIPKEAVEAGHAYRARVRMKDATGRWSHWSAPVQFTAGLASLTPAVENLRVTEIHYNPLPGPTANRFDAADLEFIELANLSDRTLDLTGIKFVDGIQFDFTGHAITSLAPRQHVVVVGNKAVFESFYGRGLPVAGEFGGADGTRLNNAGEEIQLMDASGAIIQQFSYDDQGAWPRRADGLGSSLEIIDPRASASDPSNWRASIKFGGTPGTASVDAATTVVINEILDDANGDRIELRNVGRQPVDAGGWYLSDTPDDYFKYRVPSGTSISAGGYAVLSLAGSGLNISSLESGGLWLLTADEAGRPVYFADPAIYDAAPSGVAIGRLPDGEGPFTPLNSPTLGRTNTARWVGGLVLSEIHYAPADPDGSRSLKADDFEYVEIYNRSDRPIDLGDWQLSGSIRMTFTPGMMIEPGAAQLLVPFDPSDARKSDLFRFTYNIGAGVRLVGPYADHLGDERGNVGLVFNVGGLGAQLAADQVTYQNSAPWPVISSQTMTSLTRREAVRFGDDPSVWRSAPLSPGTVDVIMRLVGDSNGDGRFDQLDIVRVLQAGKYRSGSTATFAEGDWNGDGVFDMLDITAALQTGRYLQEGGKDQP